MAERIECEEHGYVSAKVICQHLGSERGLNYARIPATDDSDGYETAMCVECESLLLEENGWTDKLWDFAGWKLICEHCYNAYLLSHQLVIG